MTTAVAEEPTRSAVGPRSGRRWQPWALAAVCALSAVLHLWGIGGTWGNTYYSAAVKSMSETFTNFFFGSFDPAGVVTVDKPPMSLWAQVLSVQVFGYHAFAVLLPQAVAGTATVFLLHRAVRPWAGENAALLASLVLAVTPITVMINRDNNPDTLLVLFVVAAAWAMTRAMSSERSTSWVALAALLVGCGFTTKMLQAWMVLPAFVLAYFAGSRASWGRKAANTAVAAVVLLVSSFWWVVVTALWSAPKPYVGGSTNGSAWDLVFGYNGFGRILGGSQQGGGSQGGGGPGGPGGGGGFSGSAGVLRLFNEKLGGQISWLLPLCGLVLVAVVVAEVRSRTSSRHHLAGWVLWGGWLLTLAVTFSSAQGTMHPYYTTMLAPAVGAVAGAGLVRFRSWYRQPTGWSWLLLPAGLVLTAGWAFALVARDLTWNAWAGYLALGLGAVALVALLLGRGRRPQVGQVGLALGLAAVLTVPTAWSALGLAGGQTTMGGANPSAGPPREMGPGGSKHGPPGGKPGHGGKLGHGGKPGHGPTSMNGQLSQQERSLLDFVRARAGGASIPLAAEGGAMSSSSYIINSDVTVVGMGGFTGSDSAPTVDQLARWKQSGQLGFVLLGGGPGSGPSGGGPPGAAGGPGGGHGGPGHSAASAQRQAWVKQNCTLVDPAAYGGQADSGEQLYSCR